MSWAYLHAFARLGYGYILTPALDPVRRALIEPSTSGPVPPTIALFGEGRVLSAGDLSLVMAVRRSPFNYGLVGLGVDFGSVTGVLPISADREAACYPNLERLLAVGSPWIVDIAPIERIIPAAVGTHLKEHFTLTTGPYDVAVTTREMAAEVVMDSAITPERRRVRRQSRFPPEEPPGRAPDHLTSQEWRGLLEAAVTDFSPASPVPSQARGVASLLRLLPSARRRHFVDLRHVLVEEGSSARIETVNGDQILAGMRRLEQQFKLVDRPRIVHREMEIGTPPRPWYWARITWPDETVEDVGPCLSRGTLLVQLSEHLLLSKR